MHLAYDTANACLESFMILPNSAQKQGQQLTGTDPFEQAISTRQILDETRELVTRSMPVHTSAEAQAMPEMLIEADNAEIPILNAVWNYTKTPDHDAVKPVIMRRYHQGSIHYATSDEPAPELYPKQWVKEDCANMAQQVATDPTANISSELMQEIRNHALMAELQLHCLQLSCWTKLAQLADELGLPPTASNNMLESLGGLMPKHHTQHLLQKPTDEATTRAIIQASLDAGADDRELLRIAHILEYQELAHTPKSIAVRHARAIARTARRRGVPQRLCSLMQQALTDPNFSIADGHGTPP